MKVIRNFIIACIAEFIVICFLAIYCGPEADDSLYHITHGDREVQVIMKDQSTILIIARDQDRVMEESIAYHELYGEVHIDGAWDEDTDQVYLDIDTDWKRADGSYMRYAEYTIDFGQDQIQIIKLEKESENETPTSPVPNPEEPKETDQEQSEQATSHSVPVVAEVKTIRQVSDLSDEMAVAPSKPQSDQTNDEQIYQNASGTTYDLRIVSGAVSVTMDGGISWMDVPINGGRLQDFWLDYIRMGAQSYWIDDSIIMIGYAQKYMQPHIILSNDQGRTWQDVRFDCGDVQIRQISLAKRREGGVQILMYTGTDMLFGTTKDGIDWTFEKPVRVSEDLSGMYHMALMGDGAILITVYGDCLISTNGGDSFTRLSDSNKAYAKRIDPLNLPYEKDQRYHILLDQGAVISSTDGQEWKHE